MLVAAVPSVPGGETTFDEQLEEAEQRVFDCIQKTGKTGYVLQQTIFLKDFSQKEHCQQLLRKKFGKDIPVNVYVPQPPCEGQMLAMEVLVALNSGPGMFVTERKRENFLAVCHSGMHLYFCACHHPAEDERSIYSQSVESFQKLDEAFESEQVPFENVIRTWLYLGNITEPAWNELEGETQRYKELNRARTDFFRGIRFFEGMMPVTLHNPAYPASTGIGGQGDTLVMSALAVKFETPEQGVILPLENPQQISAFDYGEEYSLKSPKFARALLLASGERGMVFVSGTASITGEVTRHPDNPVAQTEQTLENIAVLIDEANLSRHGKPGFGSQLDELAVARIYVKRREDYEKIRAVCERRMPNVPKIYTIADVCRPDLLVEIEGCAFCGR